jgi:hypothetical protein
MRSVNLLGFALCSAMTLGILAVNLGSWRVPFRPNLHWFLRVAHHQRCTCEAG